MKKYRKYDEDCLEWFEMNDKNFGIARCNKDEFNHKCKVCQTTNNHNNYMKNREKRIEQSKEWSNNNVERVRANKRRIEETPERIQYHRERSVIKRLRGDHKRWAEKNPEKMKQYAKNHRNHDITDKEWEDCLKVFGYKCCYCGISQEDARKRDNNRLHKDHKDNAGYNDLRNAIPACRSCNDKKWAFDMEEWFRQQSFFTEEKLEFINWWCNEGYKEFIEDKPPYRVTRKRIYNEDKSYKVIFELWSVDEKRNLLECLTTGNKKKDLNPYIEEHYKN